MPAPLIPNASEPLVDIKTGMPTRAWRGLLEFIPARFKGEPKECFIRWGTGSPESVITGPVGSLYLRTDGGASTTLYVKQSGTGNTGWVAK